MNTKRCEHKECENTRCELKKQCEKKKMWTHKINMWRQKMWTLCGNHVINRQWMTVWTDQRVNHIRPGLPSLNANNTPYLFISYVLRCPAELASKTRTQITYVVCQLPVCDEREIIYYFILSREIDLSCCTFKPSEFPRVGWLFVESAKLRHSGYMYWDTGKFEKLKQTSIEK